MPDTASMPVKLRPLQRFLSLIGLLLTACQAVPDAEPPVSIKLYQTWQLQPGDRIAGYPVLGGLGDISIELNNNPVYAPFDGRMERDTRNCLLLSSPEVPAYMFRLCGLVNPRLGRVNQGDVIGRAVSLQFAALRRQPNGTWAIVEPSKQVLERTLTH